MLLNENRKCSGFQSRSNESLASESQHLKKHYLLGSDNDESVSENQQTSLEAMPLHKSENDVAAVKDHASCGENRDGGGNAPMLLSPISKLNISYDRNLRESSASGLAHLAVNMSSSSIRRSFRWKSKSSCCRARPCYIPLRQKTVYRSKWDFQSNNQSPAYEPRWLKKVHKYLPWYVETEKYSMGGPWVSARAFEVPYRDYVSELSARIQIPGEKAWFLTRLIFIFLIILVLLLINVIFELPLYKISADETGGIRDPLHDVTVNLARYIQESAILFNGLVFTASLFMDLAVLLSWLDWVFLGDSSRLMVAFVLFYGIRAFMKIICTFPYPQGYKWEAPVIFGIRILSLVVPYQGSDDFFYSGHVGCCALIAIEHYYNRKWILMGFSIFTGILESFTLLVTRAHYVVDMVIGIIMAHYSHHVARRLSRIADQWLGLPVRLVLLKHEKVSLDSPIV